LTRRKGKADGGFSGFNRGVGVKSKRGEEGLEGPLVFAERKERMGREGILYGEEREFQGRGKIKRKFRNQRVCNYNRGEGVANMQSGS